MKPTLIGQAALHVRHSMTRSTLLVTASSRGANRTRCDKAVSAPAASRV
ncbi:hypothetical protein [Georhizobium profundi]|nr:hypothetical protein [Georhizobium profundi]